jgi:predicted transposase/invertase (TIGR01784 family)
MFGAVMTDEENCRGLLELILGFPIGQIEISKEKSIVYHPEYKGIRMDVFAKDENNTHYNVEMQVVQKTALPRRARYYHSQIDMESLLSGSGYEELPDTYVIFICDFDPFGRKKYCYTFRNMCLEDQRLCLKDGAITIFLSTCGENKEEVSPSMVSFLEYVKADESSGENASEDPYVKRLQEFIRSVKKDREMEERFMLFEELLRDERAEGREEGREEGLAEGRAEGREEGLAEGRAEGREEGLLSSIQSLMESMNWSVEQVMSALKIPEDERDKYASAIHKKQ